MTVQEFLIDEAEFAWIHDGSPGKEDPAFQVKQIASGEPDEPGVAFGMFPAGFVQPAHFHDQPQFQVVLEGTVKFPVHSLLPVAVHYSDANNPYGPFSVGPGIKVGIFRPAKAGIVWMHDREGRKSRNPNGREFYGQLNDNDWTRRDGESGIERQQLIDGEAPNGPTAEMLRCDPGTILEFSAAPHGAFHVVIEGSIEICDEQLQPYSMRYAIGNDQPAPLLAGPKGVKLLSMTFGPS